MSSTAAKGFGMLYGASLVLFAVFWIAAAWGQDTAGAALATDVVLTTGAGSMVVDLGSISLPGALVVCVAMIIKSGGLPIKVHHFHYRRKTGMWEAINEEQTGPIERQ